MAAFSFQVCGLKFRIHSEMFGDCGQTEVFEKRSVNFPDLLIFHEMFSNVILLLEKVLSIIVVNMHVMFSSCTIQKRVK